MSEQTSLFADVAAPRKVRFVTHYYSKADIMKLWNIQDHVQFERFIGDEGKAILGWRAGKQKFTPKQFRELIGLVGLPLQKEELGQ
jgi:hypothetical protein